MGDLCTKAGEQETRQKSGRVGITEIRDQDIYFRPTVMGVEWCNVSARSKGKPMYMYFQVLCNIVKNSSMVGKTLELEQSVSFNMSILRVVRKF